MNRLTVEAKDRGDMEISFDLLCILNRRSMVLYSSGHQTMIHFLCQLNIDLAFVQDCSAHAG
jgi:hypothetical protein